MRLSFSSFPSPKAVLIYPLFEKENARDVKLKKAIAELKASKKFEAKEGQTFFLFNTAEALPRDIVLLGLGEEKKLTASSLMSSLGGAVKSALSHRPQLLSIIVHPQLHCFIQEIAETVVLASYQAGLPYKTGESQEKLRMQTIAELELVGVKTDGETNSEPRSAGRARGGGSPDVTSGPVGGGDASPYKRLAEKGLMLGQETNILRDWINAPPNFADPDFFEAQARKISKASGAKLTILRKKQIEKLKMGALLGVNRGSANEPRLIMLDYHPKAAKKSEAPIVFVGKGIIFDTGGYNLKPSGHIEDMHLDKTGAATVLALIGVAAKLGISRRIVAVAPITDNVIGPRALKPSEILTTYSGKTIEITNTDAEGRLILSDALAYARDIFKPKYIIDIATLTGACVIALGERYAGLFGTDEKLMDALRKAGDEVDELLWHMPIHKDDAEKIKGIYADLRNSDPGTARNAGASKAAAFLKEFIGDAPWAHLDVAGPAFVSDPKKYENKGATGFGLRVLARFLEQLD